MNMKQKIQKIENLTKKIQNNPAKIDTNIKRYKKARKEIEESKDYLDQKALQIEEITGEKTPSAQD